MAKMHGYGHHVLFILPFIFLALVHAVWPLPRELSSGSEMLWLDTDFVIVCENNGHSFDSLAHSQAILLLAEDGKSVSQDSCQDFRLRSAVKRAKSDILSFAFSPWKFHSKGVKFEPDTETQYPSIGLVRLQQERLAFSDEEEAYDLFVAVNGSVLIRFNGPLGAVRAFNTFTQLVSRHSDGQNGHGRYFLSNAPLQIQDYPSYKHRGLNLDISRNIITPKDVTRTLEAMAFNKLNRLHIHAADAQSWPLEIPTLPKLAEKGAYHKSQIWSVADLYTAQSFGAERGVDVYIEIDMPGHVASIVEAYPHLITSFKRKPWEKYSLQPPAGQLKLSDLDVTAFVGSLLNDLLPRVAPFSSLFHLGGDEIKAAAYNMTTAEMRHPLQGLVDHAVSLLHAHGMTPVVWEEHVLEYNLTLPPDTLIQAWKGSNPSAPSSLAQLTHRGYRALFGANDYWYLDCGHGGWLDPDIHNPDSSVKRPFLDYCGPYHNWREVYSYDPLADIPTEQQHLVIGGEASMWGEQTDGLNLDSNLWPRLAAAGEVLWHGKGIVSENVTRRLAEMREWLVAKGVAAGPVQVTWCLMNPGNCVS